MTFSVIIKKTNFGFNIHKTYESNGRILYDSSTITNYNIRFSHDKLIEDLIVFFIDLCHFNS